MISLGSWDCLPPRCWAIPGNGAFQPHSQCYAVTSKSSDTKISQESGPTSRKTRILWWHPGAGVDLRRRLLEPCGGNIDEGRGGLLWRRSRRVWNQGVICCSASTQEGGWMTKFKFLPDWRIRWGGLSRWILHVSECDRCRGQGETMHAATSLGGGERTWEGLWWSPYTLETQVDIPLVSSFVLESEGLGRAGHMSFEDLLLW